MLAFGDQIHAKYYHALLPSINFHKDQDPVFSYGILALLSVHVFPAFLVAIFLLLKFSY